MDKCASKEHSVTDPLCREVRLMKERVVTLEDLMESARRQFCKYGGKGPEVIPPADEEEDDVVSEHRVETRPGPVVTRRSTFQGTCYRCEKVGHRARDCVVRLPYYRDGGGKGRKGGKGGYGGGGSGSGWGQGLQLWLTAVPPH